ncbi:MAG: hypothetical protein IT270_10065 [Saprospiraceae bacterium]|nr:hypothetical protein [Saprospiraceae bacterium]
MKPYSLIITLLLTLPGLSIQAQTRKHTTVDYGNAFGILSSSGGQMDMGLAAAMENIKGLKKLDPVMDFRTECLYPVNESGLNNITFYFDKDNHEPLYEIIMDFEDADTLAAFIAKDLGVSNHPRLDDHWVMSISPEGTAYILWRFENKLIFAANLPGTELEGDYTFELDQDFITRFNNGTDTNTGSTEPAPAISTQELPADHEFTQLLNQIFGQALVGFEGMKGAPLEGKKDAYLCIIDGEEQADVVIRKNANNSWRLDAKIGTYEGLDTARDAYNALKTTIQNLEALEYTLSKKSEYSTNTGNTYIWDVQSLDGEALGMILKLQLYASGQSTYSVRLEIGK